LSKSFAINIKPVLQKYRFFIFFY